MKRFHAKPYISLAAFSGSLLGVTTAAKKGAGQPQMEEAFTDANRKWVTERLVEWGDLVRSLGAPGPLAVHERIIARLAQPNVTFHMLQPMFLDLISRVNDELSAPILLMLEASTQHFYTGTELFGPAVAARFPAAAVDLEEAGKCLAVDRGTACVFHLMRVLELGLQALEAKLQANVAKDRNWQAMLNDVNGAVKRLPQSTGAEKAYHGKCSEAAMQLQHVKDAWRNDVMHPRDTYTVEQAKDVFECSKRLMCNLADWV